MTLTLLIPFQKLSVKSKKNGVWYAKSSDGKSIYRYFEDQGKVHWSGSTGDKNAPLAFKHIPNDIVKALGFSAKGKH
jgi:hypothetical protein